MKIQVLTFGVIKEIIPEAHSEVAPACSVLQLRNFLNDRHSALRGIPYLVAVNKSIAPEQYIIQTEDEIALLPPFSGG